MAPKASACACFDCRQSPSGFTMQTNRVANAHREKDRHRALAASASQAVSRPPATNARTARGRTRSPEAGPARQRRRITSPLPHDPLLSIDQDTFAHDHTPPFDADDGFDMYAIPSPVFSDTEPGEGGSPEPDSDTALAASPRVSELAPPGERPAPAVPHTLPSLPPFAHGFVHHSLSSAERMSYIHAAVSSVTGTDFEAVSNGLAYSNAMMNLADESTPARPTTDPFEAYRRLGVDSDLIIQRFAVCDDESCFFAIPVGQLSGYDADVGHDDSEGQPCIGGRLFKTVNGKRVPVKVLAFVPPSTGLQIFFRDRKFVGQLQAWRNNRPEDAIGDFAPTRGFPPHVEESRRLTSVFDGTAWRSRAWNKKRTIDERGVTDELLGAAQRIVSLEYGLLASINVDWFAVKDVHDCSPGAVYVTILNLPRHLCFKRQYTLLALIIPGPREPSKLAMNRVLEPLIKDLQDLEKGILMNVAGQDVPKPVYLQLLFNASDMPATRKLLGNMSHNYKKPCNHCRIYTSELDTELAYDRSRLDMIDGPRMLQDAARHLHANSQERDTIEQARGVRWSEMCRLIDFTHSDFAPPDTMHGSSLGMTRHLVIWLVKESGVFGATTGEASARRKVFGESLLSFTWPSHTGRLPANIVASILAGKEGTSIKADEWARVRTALPTCLWIAIRDQENDQITDSRCLSIFRAVIDFVASLRTLLARAVNLDQLDQAQAILSRAVISLVQLGMPTSINWHMSCHYADFIRRYGPVGSFATWSYERNNGVIARTRFFKGGQLQIPTTAMRRWYKEQLLRSVLDNESPNSTSAERAYLERLTMRLDAVKVQGTLLLEEHRANAAARRIILTKAMSGSFDLTAHGLYTPTIHCLRRRYPDKTFREQASLWGNGLMLYGDGHTEYGSIQFNGYRRGATRFNKRAESRPRSGATRFNKRVDGRFCSLSYKRGERDRWATSTDDDGSHEPCRIERLFKLNLSELFGIPEDECVFAAVRFLSPADDEITPWSERSIMLNQRLTFPLDPSSEVCVLPVNRLLSPLAVQTVRLTQGERCVIISLDKEIQEFDVVLDEADE